MFKSRDVIQLVLAAAFLVVLIVQTIVAQDTIIQEPAVIVLHNDAQSLHEIVANHSTSSTSIRLSLVCAAYGEPDYPTITWSSPINGIKNYSILAMNNTSVNITDDHLSNPRVTVSILDLCDVRPENLTEYLCEAVNSNGPRQNLSLSRPQQSLGASGVMFSFANGNVEVALSKIISAATTTRSPPSQSSEEPSMASTPSQNDGTLSPAVVAIISTLVVCTVVVSAAVLASTIIVVICKSTKGSREETFRQRAQTDNDSLYDCNAYTYSQPARQQTDTDSMYDCTAYGGHQSQNELTHTYNYIDAPTSPKDKKPAIETFAVYQCPAYGAQNVMPSQDGAMDLVCRYTAMDSSDVDQTGETVYNYVEQPVGHNVTTPL